MYYTHKKKIELLPTSFFFPNEIVGPANGTLTDQAADRHFCELLTENLTNGTNSDSDSSISHDHHFRFKGFLPGKYAPFQVDQVAVAIFVLQ